MAQGSSGGRDQDRLVETGVAGLSDRAALLTRASLAVRRAHATHADEQELLAALAEATMIELEERALSDAERGARAELEVDVRSFATRLRQDGAPPEQGVRQIKSAVEPAVFVSTRGSDGADVEWRRALVGDVVRWFVESYYAG
jgi:hypothetical protein